MRRVNIRKRNNFNIKNINKKVLMLIYLTVFILFTFILIFIFILNKYSKLKFFEQYNLNFSSLNAQIPFSLNKIVIFSSATANTQNINQSMLELDISQYSDIGIYINNLQNTNIKSLYINNISINSLPEKSRAFLYKKSIPDLGKCTFDENKIISDNLYFNIVSLENEINYNNYEVASNLSIPIALGFYNQNVKEKFLTDANEITLDGTLLKKASVLKSSITANISFCINIIDDYDAKYICNVNFDIPIQNDTSSIYKDGSITQELNERELSKFIRVK